MKETIKQRVIDLLKDNPALLSKSIAHEVESPLKELKAIYKEIKGVIQPLDKRTFGISSFFQMVLETEVLPDKNRVEKFRNKEFVFPNMLELHFGTSCHCACRFCWRWENGQWKPGDKGLYIGKKGYPLLQKQNVIDILHEFKENGGTQLYLSGGLEFFTSELAEDTIKSASELGLIIRAYTNGIADCFEKEDFIDLLIDKAEYIRFSVHAVNPDTYAKVQMPHRDKVSTEKEFLKLKDHIRKMVKRRKRYENLSRKVRIFIAFLVINDNFHEIKEAIDMWKEIGVDSFDIRVDMRDKKRWFTKKQEEELNIIMDEISTKREHGAYHPMKLTGERHEARHEIKLPETCFIPFKKPAIDPWGNVYTCCYRAHPSLQHDNYKLGNIQRERLGEILKRNLKKHKIPFPHCAQCTDWELTYNRCIEKVSTDWDDGFPPESLPFIAHR